jgi:hypothetical protein
MALTFNSTDVVTVSDHSSIQNLLDATRLFWVYLTSDGTAYWFLQKGDPPFHFRWLAAANEWRLQHSRATTPQHIQVDETAVSAYGLNKWLFFAVVGDSTTDANNKFYLGDLTTPASVATSYITQSAGSGTITSDASIDLLIGNSLLTTTSVTGSMAHFHLIDAQLTQEQIWQQQFHPHVLADSKIFMHLGWPNATGTQVDYSGTGNDGTATGTVYTAHPPVNFSFPSSGIPTSSRLYPDNVKLAQIRWMRPWDITIPHSHT